MTGHLSALDLDEAAAGLGSAQGRAHLDTCPPCREKLAVLSSRRAALIADPGYGRTLARITQVRSRSGPARFWAPALGGVAAAAAILLVARPGERLRVKGSASVELLDASGKPQLAPKTGGRAVLKISVGAHTQALVIAIDEADHLEQLWPPAGRASGAVVPGAHFSIPLLVTPGAVRVVAGFSDRPISPAGLAGPAEEDGVQRISRRVEPAP